jgi:phosphate starvation-inducible protein PhoH
MKPDKSVRVPQRDKIKNPLEINELNWTDKQKEFIQLALDKDVKIILVEGPAGSSKTLLSVFCALKLLSEKRVSDIVYIRSAVESSDSRLGYLPGDVGEKLHFYNLPFMDKLEELLSKQDIERLGKEQRLTMYPVNFSRGMSWNAKCVIFDEAQNSTAKEIVTVLTRLGKFSKCFVLADPTQTDLHNGKCGGFEKISALFHDEESAANGIRVFKFSDSDIMRSELVKFLVKKFKEIKIS